MNYRVAVGTKATMELFTTSETLPLPVIIDQDGMVRDMVEGIMNSDEFDLKVKPLLVARIKSKSSLEGLWLRLAGADAWSLTRALLQTICNAMSC
jgi:hypothetical protein